MSPLTRRMLEACAVAVLAAVLALAWFGFPAQDEVCGAGGLRWAWRLAAGDGAGPWGALGALARPLGEGLGWLGPLLGAVALGAGSVWWLARARGSDALAAALATTIASTAPALVRELAGGALELAIVPFVALALGGLPSQSVAGRVLGLLAIGAVAATDARAGVVLGIVAAVAGGGALALLGALLAAGSTAVAGAVGAVDPVDVAAPLLALRVDAVAPGLAALAAALWFAEDRGLRRASLVAFAFSLGPVLAAFGDPLTIGGMAVPLPGIVPAVLTPTGAGWGGALVVAAVASGLAIARAPRVAWILAPVVFLEVRAVAERPECLALDVPIGVLGLAERTGGVLDLPARVALDGDAIGAPATAHALYLWQGTHHGRPLATGLAPIAASDPLLGEPAVVLSLNATTGAGRFLMPPSRPGEVLRGLGVTEIVVHRDLYGPGALAVLDPILLKLYGAPQRDHAGGIDLYRVSATGSARPPTPESLHPSDGPAPKGWLEVGAWLAGFEPAGAAGAAPSGEGRAEPGKRGDGPRGPPKKGRRPRE